MWRARLLVAIAVGAGLELALVAEGMGPRLLLVGGIVAVVAAVIWLTRDVAEIVVPIEWPSMQPAYVAKAVEWRVGTLQMLLMKLQRSEGMDVRLHNLLIGLIDDRLLSEHRIDRDADPHAAADIIGAELTAFVTAVQPLRRLADPREVARIVTLIEKL